MKLVLYCGWPCALALVVFLAGLRLGEDSLPPGRRLSMSLFGKFEALSVCVQAVTGERGTAEKARALLESALSGLTLPASRPYTVPAVADVDCGRDPAHYGASAKARRVAARPGGRGQLPSPYHLHVYLMPPTSLRMLRVEPYLQDRRVEVEEYVARGTDASTVLTGVTFGLYTTSDELANGIALRQFFEKMVRTETRAEMPH